MEALAYPLTRIILVVLVATVMFVLMRWLSKPRLNPCRECGNRPTMTNPQGRYWSAECPCGMAAGQWFDKGFAERTWNRFNPASGGRG